MTRHPWVTAAAVGLCVFIVAVAPFLYAARLIDDVLRAEPRKRARTRHPFPRGGLPT